MPGNMPRVGDHVWLQERHPAKQPNGEIVGFARMEGLVIVKFYDEPDAEIDTIELDTLTDHWTDKYGGSYCIARQPETEITWKFGTYSKGSLERFGFKGGNNAS